jgi:hypothetical protein
MAFASACNKLKIAKLNGPVSNPSLRRGKAKQSYIQSVIFSPAIYPLLYLTVLKVKGVYILLGPYFQKHQAERAFPKAPHYCQGTPISCF